MQEYGQIELLLRYEKYFLVIDSERYFKKQEYLRILSELLLHILALQYHPGLARPKSRQVIQAKYIYITKMQGTFARKYSLASYTEKTAFPVATPPEELNDVPIRSWLSISTRD